MDGKLDKIRARHSYQVWNLFIKEYDRNGLAGLLQLFHYHLSDKRTYGYYRVALWSLQSLQLALKDKNMDNEFSSINEYVTKNVKIHNKKRKQNIDRRRIHNEDIPF